MCLEDNYSAILARQLQYFPSLLKLDEGGRDIINSADMSCHIVRLVNSDIIMHLPFGFISCLFSPQSPLRDKLYEAKLKFMPEHKHNSDSVKSVRTKMPKSERDTGKGIFFAH